MADKVCDAVMLQAPINLYQERKGYETHTHL